MRWLHALLAVSIASGLCAGDGTARDLSRGSGGTLTVDVASPEAYSQPAPLLREELRPAFFRGRNLFRQVWVIAPVEVSEVDGLGPVYNRLSCLACHVKNGRGFAPDRPDEEMRTMVVRLSVAGRDDRGGPAPHAAYGDQLNELGVPGVPGEGRAFVRYTIRTVEFEDGERLELRAPTLDFRELHFGPLEPGVMTSMRIAPPVFGLGLLEAVPEETLLALAERPGPQAGRVNRVWNIALGRPVIGRFGVKANQPDLRQQIAAAFSGDLGITSMLFPAENCTPAQRACSAAPSGGHPELSERQLDALVLYVQLLAVPARRHGAEPAVVAGEQVFDRFGCTACHVRELVTGEHPTRPELSHQTIRPYSDLLLHDMGDDLADGRPDFAATGREWRTPPLWGIGLAPAVGERVGYLHDGRARTLMEAILWHGGEGASARAAVLAASRTERAALIRFLESL